jgi:DNA-binding response OmpR family regulator
MAKKILIVDDDPDIVKLLQLRLENQGYNVIVAYDGQAGLDKVRKDNPDLVILDITLPKIDGYGVASILNADEKYKDIPIIMLTARNEFEDISKGMKLGAVSYFQKPFKADVLLGIIQGLVGDANR